MASIVGYWNAASEDPERVRAEVMAAAVALSGMRLDAYLSVKAPALGFDLGDLPRAGVPVHLDALQPDTVDVQLRLAAELGLGVTLPGRWRRSVHDAARIDGGRVRVVKGQFPDPDVGRECDPRAGFLAVVDALKGRASFVAVASHDGPLAAEALSRLRLSGTPCGLELLYGLPVPPIAASEAGAPIRVYIPYGRAYLPYAIRKVLRNPRSAGWLLKDLVHSPGARSAPSSGADVAVIRRS